MKDKNMIKIPLTRPSLPKLDVSLLKELEAVLKSGMLTNAKYVAEFERKCAAWWGVRHVVAVGTGAAALLIAIKAMDLPEGGEVILPSFTFTSTGHALKWSGLKPVFVDIDPVTFNLDVRLIERHITSKTVAILPVHVFGNPCDIKAISGIAKKRNLKVIYDAAHAFASKYGGRYVAGFGDASCFSLTPTKILTTGEGGLLATNDDRLAYRARLGRNNGDSFKRDEEFLGVSARMNEISAILGLQGLSILKSALRRRLKLVGLYKKLLSSAPGISFQQISAGAESDYKDFAVIIDESKYGRTRDELIQYLRGKGVECKAYFDPPLHRKKVYREFARLDLPATASVSSSILDLPLYAHMPENFVKKVAVLIKSFQRSKHEK